MRIVRNVTVGDPGALLLHITEENEGDVLPKLRDLTEAGFVYAAIEVEDWNRDLSPWTAPPVFGRVPFGGGAQGTLDFLVDDILPRFDPMLPRLLGGYSLAGLFALYAAYQTPLFRGVAAVSPSLWYPDWDAFADQRTLRADCAYLSLGDREEKARNPVMAKVGDGMRAEYARLKAALGDRAALEWNPGNHFSEPERRTAKGLGWVLKWLNEKG